MENMELTPRDYFVASIMDLLRIDQNNPINIATVTSLTNCLPNKEFVNFMTYMAKSNNDYKKPIEVVASSVLSFQKLREYQLINNGLEAEIKELVDKCRIISDYAYDNKPKGFNFNHFAAAATWNNFPKQFTLGEVEILDRVGGCKRWLLEYQENKFYEDLLEVKIQLVLTRPAAPAIKYNPSEVLKKLSLEHRQSA